MRWVCSLLLVCLSSCQGREGLWAGLVQGLAREGGAIRGGAGHLLQMLVRGLRGLAYEEEQAGHPHPQLSSLQPWVLEDRRLSLTPPAASEPPSQPPAPGLQDSERDLSPILRSSSLSQARKPWGRMYVSSSLDRNRISRDLERQREELARLADWPEENFGQQWDVIYDNGLPEESGESNRLV